MSGVSLRRRGAALHPSPCFPLFGDDIRVCVRERASVCPRRGQILIRSSPISCSSASYQRMLWIFPAWSVWFGDGRCSVGPKGEGRPHNFPLIQASRLDLKVDRGGVEGALRKRRTHDGQTARGLEIK
ncbi:hypothetical protein LX32DRAFT_381218 [Colletotrichum zoysiae]|uniref:Uncharacterized protein n=1 Tax=Colletotrichum zoysiae TaxID=1216348 RepID=A0AAD9HHF7_9PEZI|nr:hypothetical protein LX32DRAFT_381218 [Colletotrichum zoysiae]